jgi:hypothetical protein
MAVCLLPCWKKASTGDWDSRSSSGDPVDIRKDAFWFGESQSRIVVTVSQKNQPEFVSFLSGTEITYRQLGTVTADTIEVDGENWGAVEDWKNLYDTAIEKMLAGSLESEGALAMI